LKITIFRNLTSRSVV